MSRSRLAIVVTLLGAAAIIAQPLVGCHAQWSLDVGKAMDAIGVAPGMVVGEAGAGDGYFTFPLLDRVGSKGVVYANDIDRRALDRLRARAEREGRSNVHTVFGRIDDPAFPRKDLDMVVVVPALHDFRQPVEWMVNLKKYLRPGATLAVIDVDSKSGFGHSHFLSRDEVVGYAREAGYDVVKNAGDGGEHMFIVMRPQTSTGPGTQANSRTPARGCMVSTTSPAGVRT